MEFDPTHTSVFAEELHQKMKEHCSRNGLSEAEFARRIGASDALFKNLRNGSIPTIGRLSAILHLLGESLVIGSLAQRDAGAQWTEQKHKELFAPTSPVRVAENAQELHDRVVGQDFEPIPRYDVFLAAGDGALNDNNTPVEHLAFSKAWLKRMNVEPGMAALLSVKGESMQPTLFDGDLVLVDRNRFAVQSGKIYAFVDGDDGARVKRLRLFGNAGLVIQSDNHSSEFEDEERSGQEMQNVLDNIIGEVLWSGHTWD